MHDGVAPLRLEVVGHAVEVQHDCLNSRLPPSRYGGSVYTRDVERGRRFAAEIEAGMVFAYIYEDMPFGGIEKFGYGREFGELGIQSS
jgi:acyl-CoA reductase-like NAD-dependent aldehyde dehydrogenase